MKRPSERAVIGLKSSPETQYGRRTTVIFMAIFTTHTCLALEFHRAVLSFVSPGRFPFRPTCALSRGDSFAGSG